ncbi:DUF7453 family protein [Marinobacterium rhizophilum]|uniref:DUF7453 family protein n=1 Tax=Marinobacterium rhizophilum TaxID=420402 RepID=UPI000362F4CE|nr:choice-of-anchor tandem repeat NxxGxxAF-containing protein [Marinobacterium rhizophilum]
MLGTALSQMSRRSSDNENDTSGKACDVSGNNGHCLLGLVFFLIFMLGSVYTAHAQTLGIEAVVLTGQQAPGPAGTTFQSSFNRAVINNAGEFAFYASTTEFNCAGLYKRRDDQFVKVTSCPVLPGEQILSESGKLVFTSNGVTYSEFDGLHPVVGNKFTVVKTPVPDGVEGELFSSVGFPVSNDNGMLLFKGVTDITGSQGFWAEINGTLLPYVLAGEPAPGMPAGTTFANLDDRAVVANDGSVAFKATTTASRQTGIWVIYADGSGRKVIAPGDPAPGSTGNWSNAHFLVSDLSSSPAINAQGEVAFRGTTTNANENGIWAERWDEGVQQYRLHNVILAADSIALPSGDIWRPFKFGWVSLNNRGELAYIACSRISISDVCGVMKAVWNESTERYDHHLIALDSRITGAEPEPGGLGLFLGGGQGPSLNNQGQVVFRGLAAPPERPSGVWGMWGWDPGTGLHRIYLAGDSIEVAPDDVRTVANFITFSPFLSRASGNDDGRPSAFNDHGQVIFKLLFEDAHPLREGLFIARLPQLPHSLEITAGPQGNPNPVPSGQEVQLSVVAEDELGHGLNYNWHSDCSAWSANDGVFSDHTLQNPLWTAPDNSTNTVQACKISITVSDGVGVSSSASFEQRIAGSGAGILSVTPETDTHCHGPVGGSFSCQFDDLLVIPFQDYRLENVGGEPITAIVIQGEEWLSLSPSKANQGFAFEQILAAGQSATVRIGIDTGANTLCAGNYSETVFFDNFTNGNGSTSREVGLVVEPAENIPPLVTAPPATSIEATALLTPISESILDPEGKARAVDDAEGELKPVLSSTDALSLGTHFLAWEAIDCSGNKGVSSPLQKVVVVDTTKPELKPPAGFLSIEAMRPLTFVDQKVLDPEDKATAHDKVALASGPLFTGVVKDVLLRDVVPPLPLGQYYAEWAAEDTSGNRSTALQPFVIVDTTEPEFTSFPADMTFDVDALPAFGLDIGAAVAMDLVDSSPVVTNDAPDAFPEGVTPVLWAARDFSGNINRRFQMITVRSAVELAAIEVIQTIQDATNIVPLIAQKTTLVRVYFESKDGMEHVVRPILRGFLDGVRLPEMLTPMNSGEGTKSRPGILSKRANEIYPNKIRDLAANFQLPEHWTTGTLTLQVGLRNIGFDSIKCENAVGNVSADCKLTIIFDDPGVEFETKLVKYTYVPPFGIGAQRSPTADDMNNVLKRLVSAYPIDKISNESGEMSEWTRDVPSLEGIIVDLLAYKFLDLCFEEPASAALLYPPLILLDLVSCPRLYYAVLSRFWPDDREAAGLDVTASGMALPLGVDRAAVGIVADGNSYARFVQAHEMGHLLLGIGDNHPFWMEMPFDLASRELAKGDDVGPCGADSSISEGVWPYIGIDLPPIPGDVFGGKASDEISLKKLFPLTGGSDRNVIALIGPLDQGDGRVIIGYDSDRKRFISPWTNFELMSYCGRNFKWPSVKTYKEIRDHIAEHFGSIFDLSVSESSHLRSVDAAYISQSMDEGENLVPKTFELIQGIISSVSGDVKIFPVITLPNLTDVPMNPKAGDYWLQRLDKAGRLIDEISFEPESEPGDPTGLTNESIFTVAMEVNPDVDKIVIKNSLNVIKKLSISKSSPTVTVVYPNGGEQFSDGRVRFEWKGADKDDDQLFYTVQFSADGGILWKTLAVRHTEEFLFVDIDQLPETENGLIRVQASDGYRTVMDTSDGLFSTPNSPPSVVILSPSEFSFFGGEQTIVLKAMANDLEDEALSDSNFQWFSDIDGLLGTGRALALPVVDTLTAGDHAISVVVTDSSGGINSDSVEITVFGDTFPPIHIADVDTEPAILWPPNHKMVEVNLSVDVHTVPELDPGACTIISVTSSEPINGSGDGNSEPDFVIDGSLTVRLRAERSGILTGREYYIEVACTASDEQGTYQATEVGVVVVPKNDED